MVAASDNLDETSTHPVDRLDATPVDAHGKIGARYAQPPQPSTAGLIERLRNLGRSSDTPTTTPWLNARMVTKCDEDARPGYNTRKAHEYMDEPQVLKAKVKLLADLFRQSKCPVTYTGAGISTAAGVKDYATKSGSKSVVAVAKKTLNWIDTEPTSAHYALAEMFRAGHLSYWVQQNHDGLPQKAGFPQHAMNEIHGGWFDPANPVVKMNGSLRPYENEQLSIWQDKADLVLTLGTSLAGMNADRLVERVCARADKGMALGAVIVGIQQTRLDSRCALRIFGTIDMVMQLLLLELGVTAPTPSLYKPASVPADQLKTCVFSIKYNQNGEPCQKNQSDASMLDLREGARVKLTTGNPAAGTTAISAGEVGTVVGRTKQGHFRILFENKQRPATWGLWYLESGARGSLPFFPVVNC